MNFELKKVILKSTGAVQLQHLQDIQTLWSGYGKIIRYGLKGAEYQSVVVKYVKLPDVQIHPRGWNTGLSHQRKIKSYQVESNWYQYWASFCDESCRVPNCFAVIATQDEFFMLLEDLDMSGFPVRKENASLQDMKSCLRWLANFHATFLNIDPCQKNTQALWPIGTYWHLATRPDELNILNDTELKRYAHVIDQALNNGQFKTFVHGDAKLANFCFSNKEDVVAAVDFQYVGGGCGMKDVAYFIGSCLFEEDCERLEKTLLDYYFLELKKSIKRKNYLVDFQQLEKEWRLMYPLAWTDFHRFIKGWSPKHWKIHGYSERLSREVIANLKMKER